MCPAHLRKNKNKEQDRDTHLLEHVCDLSADSGSAALLQFHPSTWRLLHTYLSLSFSLGLPLLSQSMQTQRGKVA